MPSIAIKRRRRAPGASGMMSGGASSGLSISGNAGVEGATVSIGAYSAVSGADGSYTITGIPDDTEGTLNTSLANYAFYPARKRVRAMSANLTGQNFAATQITTTYFVRTDGNDTTGDGSTGAPWATLTKAVATVTAPCVVKVGTGTYSENGTNNRWNILNKAFASIVIFEPESGNLGDVIVQNNTNTVSAVYIGGSSNIRMSKLAFSNGASTGIVVYVDGTSSNIDFYDCSFTSNVTNPGRGTVAVWPSGTTITNLIFDGCTFNNAGSVLSDYTVLLHAQNSATITNALITNCSFPQATNSSLANVINIKANTTGPAVVNGVEISNCTITDNLATFVLGVGHDTAAQGTIQNINVYDCALTGNNHVAAFEFGVNGANIDNCTVTGTGTYALVIKESTDVEISNCTATGGTDSAVYFKSGTTSNAHNNTLASAAGVAFRLARNLTTNNQVTTWQFQNNTVNVSGTGKALAIGTDADDAGDGICDYNTYQNNSGLGVVRGDADVQSLAELQAAWADYGVTTNDANSTVV